MSERQKSFARLLDLIATEIISERQRAFMREIAILFPPLCGDPGASEAMLGYIDRMGETNAKLAHERTAALTRVAELEDEMWQCDSSHSIDEGRGKG